MRLPNKNLVCQNVAGPARWAPDKTPVPGKREPPACDRRERAVLTYPVVWKLSRLTGSFNSVAAGRSAKSDESGVAP
jgi:hypothetical protein